MTGLNFNLKKKKKKKRVKRVKRHRSKKYENNVENLPEKQLLKIDDIPKENMNKNIEKDNVETDFDKLA